MRPSPALLVLATTAAVMAQDRGHADGAESPVNRWYTKGGSASRSGVAATPALTRPPVVAWRYDAGARIRGEPLVWDDRILIEVAPDDGSRELHVVRLADGVRHLRHRARAGPPFDPSLWHRTAIVRADDKTLRELLLGRNAVIELAARTFGGKVGPPLRFEDEVYAAAQGRVVRMDMPGLKEIWRSPDLDLVGPLALRGHLVYAQRFRGSPFQASVVALQRASGRLHAESDAVPVGRRVDEDGFLAVGPTDLLHRLGTPISGMPAPAPDTLCLPAALGPANLRAFSLLAPAALGQTNWFACLRTPAPQGDVLVRLPDGVVLASPGHHRSLIEQPVAPTLAAGTLLLGACAADTESLRILWRTGEVPRGRAVPARETVLIAGGRELVALRAESAPAAAPAWPDDSAELSLAILRDGSARTGKLRRDAAREELIAGSQPPERIPQSELLLLLDRNEELAWAAPGVDGSYGFELLMQHQLRQGLLRLCDQSFKSRDWGLVQRLLARCRQLGVDENLLQPLDKRLGNSIANPGRGDTAVRDATLEREAGLESIALEEVWQRCRAAGDRRLLRFVLSRDPRHAGAIAAVRELLPEPLRGAEPFAAADWLDFVEASSHTRIGFLAADAKDVGSQTPDQLALLQYAESWRKDLVALQSDRLLIYTPVTAPGSIARCLSMGELVCDVLEGLFAGFERVRDDPRRMRILLYEDREEYLRESKRSGIGGGHLAWTGGHYSPAEQLSRMFVPGDTVAFEAVQGVFAHELTHQWLQDRCPAMRPRDVLRSAPQRPGFWIVEGFASMVEQFAFDLERRQHRTENPRDRHLDVVAHAGEKQFLAWSFVLTATQQQMMQQLDPRPSRKLWVPLGWHLGLHQQLSEVSLFYSQAAAACHFLFHAQDGRHRRALLEHLVDFYSGRREAPEIAARVGMTVDELGRAIVAHAKSY